MLVAERVKILFLIVDKDVHRVGTDQMNIFQQKKIKNLDWHPVYARVFFYYLMKKKWFKNSILKSRYNNKNTTLICILMHSWLQKNFIFQMQKKVHNSIQQWARKVYRLPIICIRTALVIVTQIKSLHNYRVQLKNTNERIGTERSEKNERQRGENIFNIFIILNVAVFFCEYKFSIYVMYMIYICIWIYAHVIYMTPTQKKRYDPTGKCYT